MRGFKLCGHAQRFLAVHSQAHNLFGWVGIYCVLRIIGCWGAIIPNLAAGDVRLPIDGKPFVMIIESFLVNLTVPS